MAPITARTLVDGRQGADTVGGWLVDWLGAAQSSLDLALYDVRLPGAVADRVASRSGELNAENVLEIVDRGLADRMAAYIDDLQARYPRVDPPDDL